MERFRDGVDAALNKVLTYLRSAISLNLVQNQFTNSDKSLNYRPLRQELELPPLVGNPLIDDKYSPYLTLALFSSVLAKPQRDWAAITVITGFTFYDGSEGTAALTP